MIPPANASGTVVKELECLAPNLTLSCEFEPQPDYTLVSLSKALYSTCLSRFSCINEYHHVLETNL